MDFGENYYTDKYQDSEDDAECDIPVVHRAAARGDIETLVQTVQHDPSVLELQKADGFTPLAEAVQAQQICAVKRLVKMGADINAQDNLGRTCLSIAAYQGWHDGVVFLLRNGAKKNICDTSGRTPLHAATYNKDNRTLCALLPNLSPSELNQEDNEQMTALHWAAFHKRPDHVQELVEKGTNILATDVDGKLALHWAAQNGCLRSCCILASIYDVDDVINMPDNSGKTPVHYAAAAGHADIIEYLASRPGCDLEPGDPDDRTPLHWSAAMGHANCVSSLVKLGVDPSPLDIDDQTPLDYAKQSGHMDCENLLKSRLCANAEPSDEPSVAGENLPEPSSEQTTVGPIGFLKKLLFSKGKVGERSSPSSDFTSNNPDISVISGNVLVTSDADPTSVVEELARSSCSFVVLRHDQTLVPKPSLYSEVQSKCDCSATPPMSNQTDEDMQTDRQKMRADVNKHAFMADRQDNQRHLRPTIQLHHQSIGLPRKGVTLYQAVDSRKSKAAKRSASISCGSFRFTTCGSTKLVQNPVLREVLRKEAEAQFQLRPGVSRKQISNHLGKLHFTPRTPGDRSGKDNDSDRDPYLKPLDDDDEDLIESNPAISRLKMTEDEGSTITRDPTPPPSTEESYRQMVSSLIRHSISECERYYELPKCPAEGLPRLYRDTGQTFKRGYLNTPLISIPAESIISFSNTLKGKDIKASGEHLLSKRHNTEAQRACPSSPAHKPSPRRLRRQEKDSRQTDNFSHTVHSLQLSRRKISPVLESGSLDLDSAGRNKQDLVNLEFEGSLFRNKSPTEKTLTLPVLSVRSGQLIHKDSGSLSVGNSPARSTKQKRPVKGLLEMDIASGSPRLQIKHGDISHYK